MFVSWTKRTENTLDVRLNRYLLEELFDKRWYTGSNQILPLMSKMSLKFVEPLKTSCKPGRMIRVGSALPAIQGKKSNFSSWIQSIWQVPKYGENFVIHQGK